MKIKSILKYYHPINSKGIWASANVKMGRLDIYKKKKKEERK